jgi:hypothetical protein
MKSEGIDLDILKTTLDKFDKNKRREQLRYYLRHPLQGLVAIYKKFIGLFSAKNDDWRDQLVLAAGFGKNMQKIEITKPVYHLADGSIAQGKLRRCYDIAFLMREKGMIGDSGVAVEKQVEMMQTFEDPALDAFEGVIKNTAAVFGKTKQSV